MCVGRLEVLHPDEKSASRSIKWVCRCACGTTFSTTGSQLRAGKVTSCGCARKEAGARRRADLRGRRYGRLVAVEQTSERRGRCVMWHCVCDCGGEIRTRASSLVSGDTTSCGCSRRLNLVGQSFGRLTVTAFAGKKKGRPSWACSCSCGGTIEARGDMLRAGATWCCGCEHRAPTGPSPVLVNHEGRRFGMLTVIERDTIRSRPGIQYWRCMCDCGNGTVVYAGQLAGGKTKSCGCLRRRRGAASPIYDAEMPDGERRRRRWNAALREWRTSVFHRDNYRCRACGGGGYLQAHHIEAWAHAIALRFDVDNGVTLCRSCHAAFHSAYGSGSNMRKQYDEWLAGLPVAPREIGWADVQNMRALASQGHSLLRIARIFGTKKSTVWDIVTGRTWKEIPTPPATSPA